MNNQTEYDKLKILVDSCIDDKNKTIIEIENAYVNSKISKMDYHKLLKLLGE